MSTPTAAVHLLRQLRLPDRYESFADLVGTELARVLVAPEQGVMSSLETAANSVQSRREGLFLPLLGKSGVGKTTFASSLSHFMPSVFTPTAAYSGRIDFDSLNHLASEAERGLRANDRRVIPLNLDHRESAPPTAEELAHIKRFLRPPSRGARVVVLWPETNPSVAAKIASDYEQIAGEVPIGLPIIAAGPPREAWRDIAKMTLEVANHVESLTDLGVDPEAYDPGEHETIGGFLRSISNDFSRKLTELIESTRKPLSLVVVFASESADAGVLSQLTAHGRYGLLDGPALLDATPESEASRWWRIRGGILVQTILRLNAHAFCLPPTPAVSALRLFGDETIRDILRAQGVAKRAAAKVIRDIQRTDLGRFLRSEDRSALESRGTPATTSLRAFRALADRGFGLARDKALNASMGKALRLYLNEAEVPCREVQVEQRLDFCPLIPDNALFFDENVLCVEYTWRKGDFLGPRSRSMVAHYILDKLRGYARELGWAGA